MEITEVRIKLTESADDRLLAFCSITLDGAFVIRDIKVIRGIDGPFVAMPSRKMMGRCPACGTKNVVRANFCNDCGRSLPAEAELTRRRLHADIAHPINSACREMVESAILREFTAERLRSRQPGYVSRYDDWGDDAPEDFEEPKPSSRVVRREPPESTPPTPHLPSGERRASDRATGRTGPEGRDRHWNEQEPGEP